MAGIFTFYLVDIVSRIRPIMAEETRNSNGGMMRAYGKVVNDLKIYLGEVVKKVPAQFSAAEVWWVPDYWATNAADTDVFVYVVTNVGQSVVAPAGGDISRAIGDDNILGMTALMGNTAISEVYWDRMHNLKELSGAAFHEAAHNKALYGQEELHKMGGFFREKPDYLSSPTADNYSFLARHLSKKVTQRPGLLPKR